MHCTAEIDGVYLTMHRNATTVFVNIIKVADHPARHISGETFSPDSSFYLLMFFFPLLFLHISEDTSGMKIFTNKVTVILKNNDVSSVCDSCSLYSAYISVMTCHLLSKH